MSNGIVISVIDDDDEVRSSLVSLLRSEGFEVAAFQAAEAFLASRGSFLSACIITDLHMQAMDGLGLQAELGGLGDKTPVIFMTAFPTDKSREATLRGGAVAFLVKPLDPDRLVETIRKVLGLI